MPVTAKLSRRFYDQLGDATADELVNWLNMVDEAQKTQLRELNELNFARFDAKMEQRMAELRSDLSEKKTELMRWMFGLWATQMLALVGVVLAVLLKP